ncbi:NtaA/DmoA family FMN-dependent monooxygenase [Compostimonas suwonensis]|uniref:FMN-dependent oxidoreductase (Nitrilotriacetate monooxygenase family) n=1 Tax=Compostimonas suwonensis TaxID=1048394 RepID=A0A2M9BVZ5_9MICO|nr:NtaA/DmoA family FMN-dependent monooxygenase [Compostimonas suwonensis]PJJ62116.1 FMN-dependent oxidoreductase (nitrilotriacetate monooxygenase family) [Compostimonas suwonensis]
MSEHIILGAMYRSLGAYPSGWRHPGAHKNPRQDAAVLRRTARLAEAAKLDYLFFGDWLATGADFEFSDPYLLARIDPLSAVAYLAGLTRRIGLIATVNTSYSDAYAVARTTASIDLLSGGRAGLNLVTGLEPRAAGNFGRTGRTGSDNGFDRAAEFVEALRLLWDSWGEGAYLGDAAAGRLLDATKLYPAEFVGEHVQTTGPLNVERPVQGHVPIVHAGTAVRSRQLVSTQGDLALVALPTLGDTVAFRSALRHQVVAAGRPADSVKVITPILPVVAETTEEAWRIVDTLIALLPLDEGPGAASAHPPTGHSLPPNRSLRSLSQVIGVALGPHELDAAVPARLVEKFGEAGQRLVALVETRTGRRVGGERPVTFRHLVATNAIPGPMIVGDAVQVADSLEEWFRAGAVDGFNVLSAFLTEQFEAFTTLVVPELVRRGLFRDEYEGRTLRDHLGLPVPPNRHTTAAAGVAAAAQAPSSAAAFDAYYLRTS